MSLVVPMPMAFLLAVVVAQIDPVAVSYLIDTRSALFSSAGKTILRAWSSFDDPMTVLLGLYLFLPFALGTAFSFESYAIQLVENLAFAGVIYGLRSHVPHMLLLAVAFCVAVPFQLMLGIALCGLFIRPTLTALPRITQGVFLVIPSPTNSVWFLTFLIPYTHGEPNTGRCA